jgi:EpsI family protein
LKRSETDTVKKRFYIHLGISVALLLFAFVYSSSLSEVQKIPINKPLDSFPHRLGNWQGVSLTFGDKVLDLIGAEDYMLRRFSNGDGPGILVYVGYFESQSQYDRIHSPKNCLPGAGWHPIVTGKEKIHLAGGLARTLKVKKILVQKELEKELVIYWYHSRGRVVANEYVNRFYLLWDAIFKKRTDGALVRLTARVNPDVDRTSEHLVSFITEFHPLLQEYLPGTRLRPMAAPDGLRRGKED